MTPLVFSGVKLYMGYFGRNLASLSNKYVKNVVVTWYGFSELYSSLEVCDVDDKHDIQ